MWFTAHMSFYAYFRSLEGCVYAEEKKSMGQSAGSEVYPPLVLWFCSAYGGLLCAPSTSVHERGVAVQLWFRFRIYVSAAIGNLSGAENTAMG